jgi:tetratricopeptide (TPR) repeat protein
MSFLDDGIELGNSGCYEEAIKMFDKELEINPQDDDAWYAKGLALFYLEQYKKAIEAYYKALEIGPQSEIILAEKSNVESLLKS